MQKVIIKVFLVHLILKYMFHVKELVRSIFFQRFKLAQVVR